MEILIRIIIEIVKAMTKENPSAKRITPEGWEAIEQQKRATEQRIREMQAAIAQQQARAKPKPKGGPGRGAAVARQAKAVPTLTQTPDAYTTPTPAPKSPTVSSVDRRAPIRELRVPFILGEIIGPPLALRGAGS